MTTAKHTPGEWFVTPRQNNMIDIHHSMGDVKGAITLSLCRVQARESWVDEAYANARLIAAAPCLLAALQDMLSGWRYIRESHGDLYGVGWDRAQGKAEAAILKATGVTP